MDWRPFIGGVVAVVATVAICNGARDQIEAQSAASARTLIGISQGSTVILGTSVRLGEDTAPAIGTEMPGIVVWVAPMLCPIATLRYE